MDLTRIYNQLTSTLDKEIPLISNLSNASSILNQLDNINWVGFYLAKDNVLYLGPFQGEVACTVIPFGKGVCGTSAIEKRTIRVSDVTKFSGHIACSSKSRSEIVTPIIKNNNVLAVIDIDSPILDRFNKDDEVILEKIADFLGDFFN